MQRTSSDLKLNPHLLPLALDGGFAERLDDGSSNSFAWTVRTFDVATGSTNKTGSGRQARHVKEATRGIKLDDRQRITKAHCIGLRRRR